MYELAAYHPSTLLDHYQRRWYELWGITLFRSESAGATWKAEVREVDNLSSQIRSHYCFSPFVF
jgi:hypothetical protein